MRALQVGDRMMVGDSYDLSKARKATVVGFELSHPNASCAVTRPIIRIDGQTATITMPGNVHEVTCRSLLFLGPVKGE